MKYGIRCIRSAGSVFGAAVALSKDADGKVEKFESKDEAQRVCDDYNRHRTPNLSYVVVPIKRKTQKL